MQKSNRIIPRRDEKQISAMMSVERGTLATLTLAESERVIIYYLCVSFRENYSNTILFRTVHLVQTEQLRDQGGCKRTDFIFFFLKP